MEFHYSTLLDIQKNTLAILNQSIDLLTEINNDQDIQINGSLIDKSFLETSLSTLENEYQKAEELELVVAVVGTMKAGKSTTINAIVGQEVLPNRNFPMTTLPTVVTHEIGLKTPRLSFEKRQPVIELTKAVAKKISKLTDDEKNELDFFHHKEVQPLVKNLALNGELNIASSHEGQKNIFKFLKELNDIMRLAKELAIEPPYGEYSKIDDLPVIKVEFQHIPGDPNKNQGKLSILDTPGPNEFGQSDSLQAIFRDQLAKASAVLLVTDFTQMNTEAGAKVREEILAVRKGLGKRFFVMINKFDNHSKNDSTKEETINYFCAQLMDGNVEKENVFPVSAYCAFLANSAITEIANNSELNEKDSWVSEFGEKAFGRRWQKCIGNNQEVLEEARDLWADSNFSEPLQSVITKANQNAATLSLESAINQLLEINHRLDEGVLGLKNSLSINVNKLHKIIKQLKNDQETIISVKEESQGLIKNQSNELNKQVCEIVVEATEEAEKTVEMLFNGKALTSQEYIDENSGRNDVSSTFSGLFREIIKPWNSNKSKRDVETLINEGEIKFSKNQEKEAKKFKNYISDTLIKIQKETYKRIKSSTNDALAKSEKTLNDKINEHLQEIIEQASKELEDSGFALNISLNRVNFSAKDISTKSLDSSIKQTTLSETAWRRSDSAWGNICSFFETDDWGWEKYTRQTDYLVIKLDELKTDATKLLEESFQDVTSVAINYMDNDIKSSMDGHIEQIANYLEKYRQTLLAGLNLHSRTKKEQETLIDSLLNFGDRLKYLKEDCDDISLELIQVAKEGVKE